MPDPDLRDGAHVAHRELDTLETTHSAVRRARLMLVALRCTVAILLLIHGTTRLVTGGVPGFGAFLQEQGFPFGFAVAVILTIAEISGTLLLLAGRLVVPVCAWLAAELLTGIVLVHARNGWFVVGGGEGGVEYSVLLIVVLLVVAGTNAFVQAARQTSS